VARTWAPWLPPDELTALVDDVVAHPRRFKADTIAVRLGITAAIRQLLDLRTIGAIDKPVEQRRKERQEMQRLAKEQKRRAAGALPIEQARMIRAHKRATAKTKPTQKPWDIAGVSRATWYRRQQNEAQRAA
jgi:hypothetical protein